MSECMTDRKHISRRPMRGLKSKSHAWIQLGVDLGKLSTLSHALWFTECQQLFVCGSLEQMTKEYCEEPLKEGWEFAVPFTFKHRAPVYRRKEDGKEVAVKLISHREGWFPGCVDVEVAKDAWTALSGEWTKITNLPLLSSPSKTGQALLWENLPRDKSGAPVVFPALPADVEKIVRANSPQHRIEQIFQPGTELTLNRDNCFQYDGRWMYAALATLDRLPIGEPRKVEEFKRYQPGWYYLTIKIPHDWTHIGLLPVLDDSGWSYPSLPGARFSGWFAEPECTLAVDSGWEIMEFQEGYAFDKGRPLDEWAQKLIAMRAKFEELQNEKAAGKGGVAFNMGQYQAYGFARAAVRQILNHCIGSLHARGYERELFVSDDNWKMWRRENAAWFDAHNAERVDGGWKVSQWEKPKDDRLSINMPHWSATIWALERARVAQWALKCDGKEGRPGPDVLVKINGDAIYATAELPFEDTRKLGQLRRKES